MLLRRLGSRPIIGLPDKDLYLSQFHEDGDGSVFPSFNGNMMDSKPWLAAFTYFAHILFVLKVELEEILLG